MPALLGRVLPMRAPGTSPDPSAETQGGVYWRDGRIVAVGPAAAVTAAAAAAGEDIRDLGDAWVIPGFVDAHTHFLHIGMKTQRPDLRGATSLAEALGRVEGWLTTHPGQGAVIAEGWDEAEWTSEGAGQRRPNRQDVDAVAGRVGQSGRPVVLRRICGHVAVAGSAALPSIRARWDDDALVDMGTGLVLEAPSLYLNEVLPSSPEELAAALEVATTACLRLGITTVGDYSQAPYRAALRQAAEAGRLRIRIASSICVQQLDAALAAGFCTGRASGGSAWLRDGGLKVFLDGSLGGHTAALREAYADARAKAERPPASGTPEDLHAGAAHAHAGEGPPGLDRGVLNWSDAQVADWFGRAHGNGIQIHAHAIGDRAIDQALHAFAALPNRDDLRHRVEHFELAHDEQVRTAAVLGVVASSQPNFVGTWSSHGGMYEERLGDRLLLNNRFATFLRSGLAVAFGSDGMPPGPLFGIAAAVRHPVVQERLGVRQAMWHYTWWSAWALHWEAEVGSLEPGKRADIVVLRGDLGRPDALVVEQVFTEGIPRLS